MFNIRSPIYFFVTRIRIEFLVSILITLPPNFFALIFMLASECVYKIGLSSPPFFHMTVHMWMFIHFHNSPILAHIGPNWLILGPNWPKLAQNWLKIGSKLAQNWLKIGSKLAQKWLKIGSKNRVVLPSI